MKTTRITSKQKFNHHSLIPPPTKSTPSSKVPRLSQACPPSPKNPVTRPKGSKAQQFCSQKPPSPSLSPLQATPPSPPNPVNPPKIP
jgi:hypothetical protein